MKSITLTLFGKPRTKKNSGQIAGGKIFPSKAWRNWVKTVQQNHGKKAAFTLPDQPYNCAALFYRDAERGDAVGYYQGIADLLEAWELLSDDKYITQWDGSRLLIDRKLPRVELTLTPITPTEK